MLNCFGYTGQTNRVLPYDTASGTASGSDTFMKDNLQFSIRKSYPKTVFITIRGVGTNEKDSSRMITARTKTVGLMYFINVDYESFLVPIDIIHAGIDIHRIGSQNKKITRGERLNKLTTIIKESLSNKDIKNVIVIGNSHGSILVHAAVLKLRMDVLCDKYINKLCVWTFGSPRYLPQGLLPYMPDGFLSDLPRVLNVYNVLDPYIRKLYFLRMIMTSLQVPNLNNIDTNYAFLEYPQTTNDANDANYANYANANANALKEKPKYYYEQNKGFLFVKNSEYYSNANNLEFSKIKGSIVKYHVTLLNLFPLLDQYYLYIIDFPHWVDNDNPMCNLNGMIKYIITYEKGSSNTSSSCATSSNGGTIRKHLYLCDNRKKSYIVKIDSNGKYIIIGGKKVYLRNIRGKYRYL